MPRDGIPGYCMYWSTELLSMPLALHRIEESHNQFKPQRKWIATIKFDYRYQISNRIWIQCLSVQSVEFSMHATSLQNGANLFITNSVHVEMTVPRFSGLRCTTIVGESKILRLWLRIHSSEMCLLSKEVIHTCAVWTSCQTGPPWPCWQCSPQQHNHVDLTTRALRTLTDDQSSKSWMERYS